jgi:gas vesicle protein
MMGNEDRNDLLLAIGIGAALGIGATLLLRSGRGASERRLLSELEPLRRDVHRRLRRARGDVERGAERLAQSGDAAGHATREALDAFRGEVAEIVADARDELVRGVRDAIRRGRRAARRARKRR